MVSLSKVQVSNVGGLCPCAGNYEDCGCVGGLRVCSNCGNTNEEGGILLEHEHLPNGQDFLCEGTDSTGTPCVTWIGDRIAQVDQADADREADRAGFYRNLVRQGALEAVSK